MKDIIQNSVLYYILIAVFAGIWPAVMYLKYLPQKEKYLHEQKTAYYDSEKIIKEILNLDPERLSRIDSQGNKLKFDYAREILQVGNKFGIRPTPSLYAGTSNKNSQTAKVKLQDVDIKQCTNFLTALQKRWADLKYNTLILTKQEGMKDRWKVNIDIVYFN